MIDLFSTKLYVENKHRKKRIQISRYMDTLFVLIISKIIYAFT
jgi:hypothetical protein